MQQRNLGFPLVAPDLVKEDGAFFRKLEPTQVAAAFAPVKAPLS